MARRSTALVSQHLENISREAIQTLDDRHLRDLEALMILAARPEQNRQRARFARSQNVNRHFRRQVQDAHRAEIEELLGTREGNGNGEGSKKGDRASTLSAFVQGRGPFLVRWVYKRRVYKARVRRDGTIRFRGKNFTSPSAASNSISRGATDGWWCWKFERAPGDWVPLDELRRR